MVKAELLYRLMMLAIAFNEGTVGADMDVFFVARVPPSGARRLDPVASNNAVLAVTSLKDVSPGTAEKEVPPQEVHGADDYLDGLAAGGGEEDTDLAERRWRAITSFPKSSSAISAL